MNTQDKIIPSVNFLVIKQTEQGTTIAAIAH